MILDPRPIWEFDHDNGHLVIRSAVTPSPWQNILYSNTNHLIVDQCAQGISSKINDKTRLPVTRGYRYFYLRNQMTGEIASLLHVPDCKNIEQYQCVHAMGHSSYSGTIWGIDYSISVFLPLSESGECWRVSLNTADDLPDVSLFFVTGLEYNHGRTTSAGWDSKLNCFLHDNPPTIHRLEHMEEQLKDYPRFQFIASNKQAASWDASEYRFFGGTYMHRAPRAVQSGRCSNLHARAVPICCALQFDINNEDLFIFMDAASSKEKITNKLEACVNREFFDRSFLEVQSRWNYISGSISIQTPDIPMNVFCNYWLKKQLIRQVDLNRENYSYITARNLMQDLIGYGLLFPEKAWNKFVKVLEHQQASGHLQRGWSIDQTGTGGGLNDLKFSDGGVWLIITGCILYRYLKCPENTLEQMLGFQDNDEQASVYEHFIRAATILAADVGPHGLSLLWEGDWNDALTGPGKGGKGESTVLTAMLVYALKLLVPLAESKQDFARVGFLRSRIDELSRALEEKGWAGKWYMRGYTDEQEPFGTEKDHSGKVWLNAQVWPVIAGASSDQRAEDIFQIIEKYLEFPQGLAILYPSYVSVDEKIGCVSVRNPGTRVNGSFYNHAQVFAVAAAFQQRKGDLAYRYIQKILPLNHENPPEKNLQAPIYLANFYVGPIEEANVGISSMMSETGTVSWLLWQIVEMMFGIRREHDDFTVDPCIPAEWPEAILEYAVDSAHYRFVIRNPQKNTHGIQSVWVDGERISGNRFRMHTDNRTHTVLIEIGKGSQNE